MAIQEQRRNVLHPDTHGTLQEDTYAGVTNKWLLHDRLSSYREGIEVLYVQGRSYYPVTKLLDVVADLCGLDRFSQGRFGLKHQLKPALLKSGIASVTHEERGLRRALLDDTDADILVGLGIVYVHSSKPTKFGDVVESLCREVRANRRLREPLDRFSRNTKK